MERRKFLGSSAILGFLGVLSKHKPIRKISNISGFGSSEFYYVKSGEFNNDKIIGQAVLSVEKKDAFRKKISELREKFNYYSELKYSSTDKYKIDITKAIIDYVLNDFDGEIWVKLIFDGDVILKNKGPRLRDETSNALLSELVTASQVKNTLYYKLDSYYGPSNRKKSRLYDDFNIQFKEQKGKQEDVLQVADLILGLISASVRQTAKNVVKVELIEYLKESCNTASFIPGNKYKNKINIL